MRLKRKVKIVLVSFFIILGILGFLFYPRKTIQDVLESSEYSYLPVEAKNFIEKAYEETGEIILTEKNKKENVPYLNPQYVEYLELNDQEREEVEEIPDVYQIDYVSEEISGATPSSYDLRNVNGKNFVTGLKDQGSLDLCWSFTANEQAESLLLKQSNVGVGTNTMIFSPRQLDYATSTNGIKDYENDNGVRPLGQGGNYFMAAIGLSNGVGFVKESVFPMNYTYDLRNATEVLNYSRSQYELDQSIMVPTLSNPTSAQLNSYISTVKQYVMDYGGVYVATQSPNYSCGSYNSDGNIILRVDNKCVQNANHAMHVIGWDDNYSYSYCAMSNYHTNNTSSCSGTVVSGTGAWILRNSWGNDTPYLYLAYDSINYDIRLSTTLSPMSSRNWDNNYHTVFDNYYILTSSSSSIYYQKKVNTPEKIQKIKLYTYGENGKYTISISSGVENYRKIKTVMIPTAGLYTIDLSSDNVVISDTGFNVEVLAASGNQAYFVKDSIEVFTKNMESTPMIETEDVRVETTGNRTFSILSKTKNIPSGSTLTYRLENASGSNYSSYLTVTNGVVLTNNVSATGTLSSSLPAGTYTLTTTYGTYSSTSTIVLAAPSFSSGNGTVSNPYVIKTEGELRLMADNLNAHYVLNNNITLTEEWTPIGTKEEPFTGSFNGGGHKIINLTVNRNNDYAGLFGYVVANNNTSIKNIILSNPVVESNGDAGALIGFITAEGDMYDPPTVTIDISNVSIIGGHVYSHFANAGALIGTISAPINACFGNHTYNINRIYNSSNVGGIQSSGMIGYVLGSPDSLYAPKINLTNIENMGDMYYDAIRTSYTTFFTGSHGTMIGYMLNASKIDLKYYIVTSYYRNYSSYDGDGLFGAASSYTTISKNYGYSILDSSVSLATMKNSSNYSSWSNFSTNWEIPTVDSVKRIPVLKNVPVVYTTFGTVNVVNGDSALLSSYMNTEFDAMKKLSVGTPSDTSVISVQNVTDSKTGLVTDVRITGLKVGTSTLTVTNTYDGYEKTLTINVTGDATADIIFYKNNGTTTSRTQTGTIGQTITLNANPFFIGGYKFVEWNTKRDGTGDSYADQASFVLTKALHLYAQWEPITYTIRYNANGGSGSMQDTTVSYDQTVSLRSNTFTRTDYTFTGWNTKADGTGTSYSNGQSISNLSSTDGQIITLYAQWSSNSSGGEYEIDYYYVHDGYIDDIRPETTSAGFKTHLTLNGYTVQIDTSSSGYVYTGGKTTFYLNGVKKAEYINIVRGDPSGDGSVNSADLLKIVKHLKGTAQLTTPQRLAADATFDNNINSADLLKIVKYLKGTATIQR